MRRKLRKRILLLSIGAGVIGSVLLLGAFVLTRVVPTFIGIGEANSKTLASVRCIDGGPASPLVGERRRCDMSDLLNDPETEWADYVLTKETLYFLQQTARYPNFWVNYLDLTFIQAFRRPTSVRFPTGEVVRLYSQRLEAVKGPVEILLGLEEEAPWMPVKTPAGPNEDKFLVDEAAKLAMTLSGKGERHRGGKPATNADVLAIVEGDTGRVLQWYENVPARLPASHAPTDGWRVYWQNGELLLVRIVSSEDLIAISLAPIADGWWLAISLIATFLAVCGLAYVAFWKWGRPILRMIDRPRISVAEAIKRGEGQDIEFKADSPDRRGLIKAVAAFANSNDGTIFVGIDDTGRIEGVNTRTLGEKDRWKQGLLNSIREAIRPACDVHLEFEQVGEALVGKLFVPRGDEPLYSRGGVVYIRKDAECVPAEPPEIIKLVAQFAI